MATALEIWDSCKTAQKRVNFRVMAWQAIRLQVQTYNDWANANGQAPIIVTDAPFYAAQAEQQTLSKNMSAVEQQQLAIRLSDENKADLDIVIPIKTGLGIPVIPIGIGVVVVAGLLWRWVMLEKRTADLSTELKKAVDTADRMICSNPTSAACVSWKAAKVAGDWQKRESLIESLQAAARKVGAGIATGLEFAIAIAAIIGIFWLFKK